MFKRSGRNPKKAPFYLFTDFQTRIHIFQTQIRIIRKDCGGNLETRNAVKVEYPFIDYKHMPTRPSGYTARSGNAMTLCEYNYNPFVNYYESTAPCSTTVPNWRFTAAFGVYEIQRPTNQNNIPGPKPLFFSYPFSDGIWFHDDADMTVVYHHEFVASDCDSLPPAIWADHYYHLYQAYYGYTGCNICNDADYSLDITTSSKLLVNYDPRVILDYWKESKIQIGFTNGNTLPVGGVGRGYLYEYHANQFTFPCPWDKNTTTKLNTLTLLPDNEYEVYKPISASSPGASYSGTVFLDVTVRFTDGSSIDRQQCISLDTPVNTITVQLFGHVKNFEKHVANYKIEVWQ